MRTGVFLLNSISARSFSMITHSVSYKNNSIGVFVEGNGAPVLFLHGWPTNSRLWNAQAEALKDNYRVIRPDWLGFGQSAKPNDHHYTFTAMKEILNVIVESLLNKDEKLTIVAHDIGGPPAILWTHENEHRVEKLILLNTVLYPFSTTLDKISHFFFGIPLLNKIPTSRFGLSVMMRLLCKSPAKQTKGRITEILNWHKNLKPVTKLKTILEPLHEGRKNEILNIENLFLALSVKKHLVIAKNDPLCYRHMKVFHKKHPQIPFSYLHHCGHYIPIDKPEELNTVLLSLIDNSR
jgi:pimeloyl-ACP methyl ester carboxylesterase